MFLIYNIINYQQSFLKYFLLIRRNFWRKTYDKVNAITLSQLEIVIAKIKKIGKYIDFDILLLKQQVQIFPSKYFHSFAKYAD